MTPRVVHVIAEYSHKEAMGRTVSETVDRVPGQHSLLTTAAHDGADRFENVVELGGGMETFPLGRGEALAAALETLRPDLVHVHGGALAPLLVAGTAIRDYRTVMTIYAWPRMPGLSALRRAGLRPAIDSNVLRPRVLATTALPATVAGLALRRAGVRSVLSPDPRVLTKLAGHVRVPLHRLGSGAPRSDLRAHWDGDSPTVIFVGRAETVRGVDTLIQAFPDVVRQVPGARLRLLLIPRPELDHILALVARSGLAGAIDVVTQPVADVQAEMAAAQVGSWPFKFDYTTSPPAMAVAEGLAVGLPTVTTSVACVRAVLGEDGPAVVVPPDNADALARGLIDVLQDQPRWQRLANRSPGYVDDRLGWARAGEETAVAYSEALG